MMEWIDAQPKDMRELIYDYGYESVHGFLVQEMSDPKQIRRIIEEVIRRRRDMLFLGEKHG